MPGSPAKRSTQPDAPSVQGDTVTNHDRKRTIEAILGVDDSSHCAQAGKVDSEPPLKKRRSRFGLPFSLSVPGQKESQRPSSSSSTIEPRSLLELGRRRRRHRRWPLEFRCRLRTHGSRKKRWRHLWCGHGRRRRWWWWWRWRRLSRSIILGPPPTPSPNLSIVGSICLFVDGGIAVSRGSSIGFHGSWSMIRGSWFMAHGSWFVNRSSWVMFHGSCFVLHQRWFLSQAVKNKLDVKEAFTEPQFQKKGLQDNVRSRRSFLVI